MLATAIFLITYFGLALGHLPGLRADRALLALAGATAMIASGLVPFPQAVAAIDASTIALLFGMMAAVAVLQLSGFFHLVTEHLASKAGSSHRLLAVVIGASGVLSAFLVNDVVCVALTPLVLQLCRRLRKPALPFLIGLATASNIGSVATITGNPQNIIIGSLSGISYLRFFERLAPIAAVGLGIDYLLIAWIYRRDLTVEGVASKVRGQHVPRALLWKSVVVLSAAVIAFFAGASTAVTALVAAAVLTLERIRPSKIYDRIDWPLLVMFAGLFVVVHGFEEHVVRHWGIEHWRGLLESPVVAVSGLSLVLSNLVSNVPAVLLFKPLLAAMPEKERAWLALAMSSTLAGNLTVLGSVANLIVVESARRAGTRLGFFEYLRVGVPLTIATTLVGVAWLSFTHY